MDYDSTDKAATHQAYAKMGIGKYFPYWASKNKMKVELVPFDGLLFRRLTGEIIPEYLLYNTKQEAVDSMRQ